MATKTKSKTPSTVTTTTTTSEATTSEANTTAEDLNYVIELSRSFTVEIENIMTSDISTGNKASALGTATKHYVEFLDVIEQKNA